MMKKTYRLLSLLLCCCLALAGCGPAAPAQSSVSGSAGQPNRAEVSSASAVQNTAVSFTDDLGRTVTVNRPTRTAALLGSFAQVWTLAGGSLCAAANDAWEDLALDLPEGTVNLGSLTEMSMELVLSSEPDFILASVNTKRHMEWRDTLEATGIPTAYFEVNNFEDYLRMLKLCTEITGRDDLYEQNGAAVQKQVDAVLARSRERMTGQQAPRVLSLTASATNLYVKNSTDNVLGTMLRDLGCVNIADSDTTLLETLSMEHILLADPDCIFIVQRGSDTDGMRANVQRTLMDDPAWSSLTAVQNNRVYFMDKTLYALKPNHRWGQAYEQLEDFLYHENAA